VTETPAFWFHCGLKSANDEFVSERLDVKLASKLAPNGSTRRTPTVNVAASWSRRSAPESTDPVVDVVSPISPLA
jgi:hypothetical protein